MIITKGENRQIQNEIRVPLLFQVFPEVSNRVIFDMNILLYSVHNNIDNEGIYINLEIYLHEKI
jgi:hypothetical protein